MAELSGKWESKCLSVPNATNSTTMLAPVSTSQKLNTGSATGNPRNKCALKPGHSLMDWIRLGNSGVDLAGTGGRIMQVTTDELAKHNTRDNAWLAIRGNVYNVTQYMNFHPGGIEELMRGVGRDATKLFDDIHAWVNYQQLLAKCYIGPLRKTVKTDVGKSVNNFLKPSLISIKETPPNEIVPRLDWIQTQSEITLYFYTRQGCNPGFLVQYKNNKQFVINTLIENILHKMEINLKEEIEWPPTLVKTAKEFGKLEIKLLKTKIGLWSTYGEKILMKIGADCGNFDNQFQYKILKRFDFNHDSFQFCACNENTHTIICPPIGYHVSIGAMINSTYVSRSYTPVDETFLYDSDNLEKNFMNLKFLIKSYPNGMLSTNLKNLNTDNVVDISIPKGNLKLNNLLKHRRFAFLAAGSGLTPFLSLTKYLLERNANRIELLQLMYFNKTAADIWCKEALKNIENNDDRFQFKNILSAEEGDWPGLKGRVSKELLSPLVEKNSSLSVTFIAVCGPSGFNSSVESILRDLQFNIDDVLIFQG